MYILLIVSGKLALESWQVTIWQQGLLLFSFVIWWPIAGIASQDWVTSSSYLASMAEGYLGVYSQTQQTPTYWALMLLLPVALLLPQYGYQAFWRLFAPEFRDLVLEASHHNLGKRLAALQQYRIPTSQRTLPLHKNAPREIEPVSALRRCADSLSAAILGHTDQSGEGDWRRWTWPCVRRYRRGCESREAPRWSRGMAWYTALISAPRRARMCPEYYWAGFRFMDPAGIDTCT